MNYRFKFLLFFCISLLGPCLALAGVEQLEEKEFRALALELAQKVPLFREVWRQDPKAEFYGGTSRDYLYWLKGKFRNANSPAEAKKIASALRSETVIDHRNFLFAESDVDIVSMKALDLTAEEFGVRKIDFQSGDVFDPKTTAGFDDRHQGFLPAEKIRLGQRGLATNATAGDGVQEIYQGKLSVHFASPEDFAKTTYAKSKENHPILLAARYLRLQAMNYFQNHGGGFPDPNRLMEGVRPEDAKAVKAVIADAAQSPEFAAYIIQPRLRSWLNGSIRKAFRSYTNPTAAMELFREFGMDHFVSAYGNHLAPINQFLFAKNRDEKKVADYLASKNVNPQELYQPAKKYFPDGFIYHGTREEEAFRGILLQGVLPSEGGAAGEGLYGVAEKNKSFSEKWAGHKDRLLRLPVEPGARIVDIENGVGRRLWSGFKGNYEEFAEAVGADILKYPYDTEAFVVKNSGILGKPEGVYRQVLTLSEILALARKSPGKAKEILLSNTLTSFSSAEARLLIDALQPDSAALTQILGSPATKGLNHVDLEKILEGANLKNDQLLSVLVNRQVWRGKPLNAEEGKSVARLIGPEPVSPQAVSSLLTQATPENFTATFQALLESGISQPGWEKHPELVDALVSAITDKKISQYENLFGLEQVLGKSGWKNHPRFEKWAGDIKSSRANGRAVKAALMDPAQNISSENMIRMMKDSTLRDIDLLEILHFRSYNSLSYLSAAENAEIGGLLKNEPMPEKELKAFFRQMKAADKGNAARNLIENVLQHPGWENHPEIMDSLIDSPEFSDALYHLRYAFEKEAWIQSPRAMDWLEKLADPKDPHISDFVLEALAAQPDSPRKIALVQKFVDSGSHITDLALLRSVLQTSLGDREQLQTVLDRAAKNPHSTINFAEFVKGPLSRHPWNKTMEWVETVSREGVKRKDIWLSAALAQFFSQNYFPGRADLLAPLLHLQKGLVGYDEMDAVFKRWSSDPEIAAHLNGKPFTQKSLSEFLKKRAKGSKARQPAPPCSADFARFAR